MSASTSCAPLQPTPNQIRTPAAAKTPSPLDRAERFGAIDALLIVVAVAQYFTLKRYFIETHQFLFARADRPPAWLIVFAAVMWGLLTAGALAPLLRNHARRPGQLPRGVGPLMFAWIMMFAIWFVLLFNVMEDEMWSFWHLERFECDSYMLLASALPLALAPGWRRLIRSIKLALLRRRRAPLRIPYGPAFAITAGLIYVWILSDRAIMSDGWGILAMTREYSALAPDGYREPLFLLLFREVGAPLMKLGLNAAQIIGGIGTLATLAVFIMLHLRMRRWNFTRRQLAAGWLLILSTLGVTQMFLGHIELYPLLIFGIVGTIHTGLDAMEHKCSPAWPALFYAFVLAGHLSAIFILPAVILMFWLRAVPPGKLFGPLSRPDLLRGFGHLLGWGCLLHIPLWLALMLKLEHPSPAGLIGAITGSLNTGAERLTFIGSNKPDLLSQIGDILDPVNLFKVAQALFYLVGGPVLVCIVAIACRVMGWKPAAPTANRPDRKTAAVLWIAFLGYGFYALAWHADWGWREDWDLFSALAPLGLLLVLRLLMPARGVSRIPFQLLAPVAVFAIALSFTQHVYNHTHATFLNNFNKIDYSREKGGFIQHEQIIRAYPRYTLFNYENGRVIIYPPGYIKP